MSKFIYSHQSYEADERLLPTFINVFKFLIFLLKNAIDEKNVLPKMKTLKNFKT